jgi:hypothetical protein
MLTLITGPGKWATLVQQSRSFLFWDRVSPCCSGFLPPL